MSKAVPGLYSTFGGVRGYDSNLLVEEIERSIKDAVSGIILCPGSNSEYLAAKVDEAIQANIPVITMYDDLPSSQRLMMIGTDDELHAYQFMEQVISAKSIEDGKTAVVFCMMGKNIQNQISRRAGALKAIKNHKDWQWYKKGVVYDEAKDNEKVNPVQAFIKTNFRSYSDYKQVVFVGLNARSAAIAYRAKDKLQNVKRYTDICKKIIITGWDSDEDVLTLIKDEKVFATSAQNASFTTQIAVSILESFNLSYLYSDTQRIEELGFSALPEKISIEHSIINKYNVYAFLSQNS